MKKSVAVTVVELRRACDALLNHLEDLGYDRIELPFDYYWEVLSNESFDMDTKPANLAVGSLWDDVDQVTRLARSPDHAYVTDLPPLASVLRAVGEVTHEHH